MESSRRIRLALELGLLALVVALLASNVSSGLRAFAWTPPVDTTSAADAATRATVPPLDAYAVIAARDVFNPAAAPEPLTDGLRLWGIGLHGTSAHAVIEDTATHRQELYRVGDEIRGARVAAITWDQVTLARGDVEATLELGPSSTSNDAAPTAVAEAPPADGARIRRTGGDAWIVDRREIAGAVDNMSGLLTQLRAVAEVQDGRPAGFRLFQIKDDSIFHRLGIENGDVVQRINGSTVADPGSLLAFLQRLRSEPRVALDIVRGGTARTLVYDLR
jgi:general secretion pathway protein C